MIPLTIEQQIIGLVAFLYIGIFGIILGRVWLKKKGFL